MSGAALLVGDVTTSGQQDYAGAVTIAGEARRLSGTEVRFGGPLSGDGTTALTVAGGLQLDAPATGLGAVSVTGRARLSAGLASSGAQRWQGPVVLEGNVALSSGSGPLSLLGSVDGPFELSLVTASAGIVLEGPVGAGQRLVRLAIDSASDARLGPVRSDVLLASASAGQLRIAGAVDGGAGGVNLSAAGLFVEAPLATDGGGAVIVDAEGDLTISAPIAAAGDLLLDAGGTLALGAQLASSGGSLRVATDVVLVADVALGTGGGALELGAVDGAFALGLDAGGGALALGTLGGTTPLAGLTITGTGTTSLGGDLTTAGPGGLDLSGAGAVTLGAGLRLDASVGDGGVNLDGSTVDGAVTLLLDGGAGGVRLGRVGATTALADLEVLGEATLLGDVTATGTLRLAGPATLRADLALTAGLLRLEGAVDGGGTRSLALGGPAILDGPLSGLASLSVDGPATLGADVSTTGLQAWNDVLTLSGDRTLTGSTVRIASLLGGAGALNVEGALALQGDATDLTALTVTGAARVAGDVTTSGDQDWRGAVTLEGSTRMLTGGAIRLASLAGMNGTEALVVEGALDLDGSAQGLSALTVTGPADLAGDVIASGRQSFGGMVTLRGDERTLASEAVSLGQGIVGALGTEELTVDGDLELVGDAAGLASLTVRGAARLSGNVSTVGTQDYAGAVTLSGEFRSLAASEVRFSGAVTGEGTPALTLDGELVLDAPVSGLGALTVTGPAWLAAGVTTAGIQDWQQTLRLGADVALASGERGLFFGAPVLGEGFDLRLDAGDGTIRFAGPATGLGAVSLASAGALRFEDALMATSLTTGPSEAAVAFLGPVTVSGETVLATAGALTLGDDGDLLRFDGGLSASIAPATVAATVRTAGTSLALGPVRLEGATTFATADAALPAGADLTLGEIDAAGHALEVDAGTGATL
ncbi:MAG: hypothetical protein V2J02_13445, partial [Pseudomonadales bacterium]|nr:hypothetical protein [Pseudomonadales bacterium]